MKQHYLLLPIVLISLTSCSTVRRMNDLINQSSYSIDANRQAIDRSTEVINQNARVVDESTKAIEENKRHLEALSSSS